MAVTLNASTSAGLVQSADLSGSLNIQSNGTTVLGVTSTGASVTGTQSVSGNLSFNSGYGSSAVAYGCRAWVNFDGTGTPAIRASGNVSSITDNGAGDFTVNFTTAMPDANYCAVATVSGNAISAGSVIATGPYTSVPTTSAYRFISATSSAIVDCLYASVSVFR